MALFLGFAVDFCSLEGLIIQILDFTFDLFKLGNMSTETFDIFVNFFGIFVYLTF